MTPIEEMIRESPTLKLSVRTMENGRIAAMIEAETPDTLRVGWGGGETVTEAVSDALVCASESKKVTVPA